MRNARKFDERITIGGVPDSEDLAQLKELGYKTLIDLRDEREKFGGVVLRKATALGLRYVSIPIARDEITMEDLMEFCRTFSDGEKARGAVSQGPVFRSQGSGPIPSPRLKTDATERVPPEGKPRNWVIPGGARSVVPVGGAGWPVRFSGALDQVPSARAPGRRTRRGASLQRWETRCGRDGARPSRRRAGPQLGIPSRATVRRARHGPGSLEGHALSCPLGTGRFAFRLAACQ